MTDRRRPIFDAVRKLLGRGLTPAEVAALDAAIDHSQDPAAIVHPTSIGPAGIALVQSFEGCAKKRADGMVEAYPDPGTGGDPWTIGWGATGPGIRKGTVWTQAQCDDRLAADLVRYASDVSRAIGDAPTSQYQFDALVSFHYNTGAIGKATLTKLHKAGALDAAANEFARWNRAGGRVLAGLTRRRAAEAELYRKGTTT